MVIVLGQVGERSEGTVMLGCILPGWATGGQVLLVLVNGLPINLVNV